MKRLWLFFALLVAGTGTYARAYALQNSAFETELSPSDPTATEKSVLKQAAPIFGMPYPELLDMYQHGEATIEEIDDEAYKVTAYLDGGDILVAIIDSSL